MPQWAQAARILHLSVEGARQNVPGTFCLVSQVRGVSGRRGPVPPLARDPKEKEVGT